MKFKKRHADVGTRTKDVFLIRALTFYSNAWATNEYE
jgi:hypothetical protein